MRNKRIARVGIKGGIEEGNEGTKKVGTWEWRGQGGGVELCKGDQKKARGKKELEVKIQRLKGKM